MKAPCEILIIKPSSLGDIVHTLPSAAMLRRAFPNARISWLINPEWSPLLDGNPHINETVLFPRSEFRGPFGWMKIPAWAKTISHQRADLVLDFQGLLRSALIAKLCVARQGKVLGLSDAREGARFFYDGIAGIGSATHAVDRYAMLTDLATDRADLLREATSYSYEWTLPLGEAPAGFAENPSFVLLHPFSRGSGKSLTSADVATFCRALAPIRVVLAGRSEASVPVLENVENLLNRTTLLELIWLIRRAGYVVSVDSGPMHIAAALTSRLVSIHTWSDPARVGPYHPEAWIWKNRTLFQARHLHDASTHQSADDLAALAHFVRAQW